MTVNELLERIDRLHPNSVDIQDKLNWLNQAEEIVFMKIKKSYGIIKATLPNRVNQVSLPVGISGYDVVCVYVDGIKLNKSDFRSLAGGVLEFSSSTREISVVYRLRHHPYSETDTHRSLLLEPPYDQFYTHYVCAQLNYIIKDFESQNAAIKMYNSVLSDAKAFYLTNAPRSNLRHINLW